MDNWRYSCLAVHRRVVVKGFQLSMIQKKVMKLGESNTCNSLFRATIFLFLLKDNFLYKNRLKNLKRKNNLFMLEKVCKSLNIWNKTFPVVDLNFYIVTMVSLCHRNVSELTSNLHKITRDFPLQHKVH